MKKTICLLTLIVALLLSATCFAAGNNFEDLVKAGEYAKAIDYYYQNILGNAISENDAKEVLQKAVDDSLAAYAQGTGTEKNFMNMYLTVQKIDESLCILNEWLDAGYSDYYMIQESKQNYADALQHLSNGNYAAAIESLDHVYMQDEEHYDDAQAKLEELYETYEIEMLAKARQLVEEGQYDEAIDCIYAAEYSLGETDALETFLYEIEAAQQSSAVDRARQLADGGQYDEALASLFDAQDSLGQSEALESSMNTLYTEQFEKTVTDAFNDADYLGAIRAYDDAQYDSHITVSQAMTQTYETCVAGYLADVRARADAAFGPGKDYVAAAAVLRDALTEANFNETLVEKLEASLAQYQQYAPIALTALDPVQKNGYIAVGSYNSDVTKDVNGTVYDSVNVILPTGGSLNSDYAMTEDDANLVYNLNFDYTTLSGVVYRPYESLSCTDTWEKPTTVKFYGDGILLYEAPHVTQDTYDPIPFTVNVAGVRNLKIVVMGIWADTTGWIGMYDYNPKVCLGDLMLSK